jgi:hypothetical protein
MRMLLIAAVAAMAAPAYSQPPRNHKPTASEVELEVQRAQRDNSTTPRHFDCLSEHYAGAGVTFRTNGEWDTDGTWYHRVAVGSAWEPFNIEGGKILRLPGMIVVYRHTASLSEPARCMNSPEGN